MFFSEYQFVHIVRNVLLLEGKEEWTANFINEYQSTLRPEVKDYVYGYCKALLAYHNRNFKAAMRHLPTQEVPDDFAYFLDIKILKVKIHYDSDDWGDLPDDRGSAMLNELENIHRYVNRLSREIAQNIRDQYNHFIDIFKCIVRQKENLQTKLNNTSPIVERKWLEEKITELM